MSIESKYDIAGLRETNEGYLPHYAWPGGYAFAYYTKQGAILCPDCAEVHNDADMDPLVGWDTSDWFNDHYPDDEDHTDARCENCNMVIGTGPLDETEPDSDKHPYVYLVYSLAHPNCKYWHLESAVCGVHPYNQRIHHYEEASKFAVRRLEELRTNSTGTYSRAYTKARVQVMYQRVGNPFRINIDKPTFAEIDYWYLPLTPSK